MRHIIIIIIFIFLGTVTTAQNIKVSGTVKDSIGNPLELANVIATKNDGSMESYSISNTEGRYQMNLPFGESYTLTASFLGFQAAQRSVDLTVNEDDKTMDFILMPMAYQLGDVELVYEMPVVVRGDTIVYNTDSFTNGTERKLEDVLKKLPGVEVDDEGGITVEGQAVGKVMVEGKDFFDGDSKLATQNIPADALKKVEILKNYNEVDQMRGLGNDQDNVAINIKLKEGKKNFWFGEIQGGIGDGEKSRYLGNAKLFYYTPKGSINFIGNANNTGDVPFTFRDYFNFTGGFKKFNPGTSLNISDSGLGFLVTQNNRANEIISNFGAANFSYEASDAWDISGFALYSDNETDFVTRSLRRYIASEATEVNTNGSEQNNRLAMAKFSTVYKPNVRLQLDYDLIAKKSKQDEFTDALSIFTSDEGTTNNSITEIKENEPFGINQNLNVYYTLNDKNIFAGFAQHLYQNEDPFYNAIIAIQPFAGILPLNNNQNGFDINQDKKIKSNKLDAKVDYWWIINEKSNLNLSLGSTLNRQDYDSSIFQRLDNGDLNNFDGDDFANNVQYNFTDLFLGAHYKLKTGIFTFTPGFNLHNYKVKSEQIGLNTRDNLTMLLPDFLGIAQFKNSESLRFNFRMMASFSDVNDYAEAYVFNNYNRLSQGNRYLENGIFQNVSLNYFNFNMFNFTNMNFGVSYNRRIDAIKDQAIIIRNEDSQVINQVSEPFNSAEVDEVLSGNGRFQKTFRKFKLNTIANVSYSLLNNINNGDYRQSENFTQNYEGSFETNFNDAPNFEIGYNRSINKYMTGEVTSTFYTDRPFANFEVNFLKGFAFTADWNYYNYKNADETVKNEYSFLGASFFYRHPDSKWEFRLDGTNLLDVDSLNQDNFIENFSTTTTEYFVQPRIVMFSVLYNL